METVRHCMMQGVYWLAVAAAQPDTLVIISFIAIVYFLLEALGD